MLKAWHRVANSKNRASSRAKSSKMSPAPMQSIKNKRKTPSVTTPTARNIGIRLNPQMPAPSTARRVQARLNGSNWNLVFRILWTNRMLNVLGVLIKKPRADLNPTPGRDGFGTNERIG